MKRIYLDHAATTPVAPEVFEAMKPYFTEKFGNPSSIYEEGQVAKSAVEESREKIANLIGAEPGEIIFTSGATESNNLAIKGVAFHANKQLIVSNQRPHIITSKIEHHSVLDTIKFLEKEFDIEATYLDVDNKGVIDLEQLRSSIKENTVLVSIMMANNEVGTIEPIQRIGQIVNESRSQRVKEGSDLPIYFHTDAVQAFQYLDIDVNDLGIDILSLTGHKFYAPKGVGLLYVRKGVKLLSTQQGGAQERKRRAGTENVPYIVGMAKAMEESIKYQVLSIKYVKKLRDKLIAGVMKLIPDTILTGHATDRLPHNASFCFKFIEGESILINLDMEGIAASSGSACTSGSLEPSHVLLAMGYDHATAHGSIRFTLGKDTTENEIDYVLEKLPPIIKKLRAMSPLKSDSIVNR